MSGAAKKKGTYDDILALPEHLVGELIDDELIVSPRPATPHAMAASAIQIAVGAPFHFGAGGPGGWWILTEPELHFAKNVLVPDVAGWRKERMSSVPDAPYLTQAPDWLCEVASPSIALIDRARKLPLYAKAGVEWVWIVTPQMKMIETFQRRENSWLMVSTHGGEEMAKIAPFDAVEIELQRLWL